MTMRLIDADQLMEHVWRDRLDSRELIAKMIESASTVKEVRTSIPLNIFERLLSLEDEILTERRSCMLTSDYKTLNELIDKYGIITMLHVLADIIAEHTSRRKEEH